MDLGRRRPTVADVDLDAVRENVRALRALCGPGTALMAVVKADGYGHGAPWVARAALDGGAAWLGVAIPEEALELRRAGIDAPVLVMGPLLPAQAPMVAASGARAAVADLAVARALRDAARAAGRPARVHLKVDTGMTRLGVPDDERGVATAHEVAALDGVVLEGVFTHFASADEDPDDTRRQLDRFRRFLSRLEAAGLRPPLVHAANSAATIAFPEAHFDLVRPGLACYGAYPMPGARDRVRLRPAMRLATSVAFAKTVRAGDRVSYGGTWTAPGPTVIATLPVGYADGYPRHLSNCGQVWLDGRRCPVAGRVCMDQVMVDAGPGAAVAAGDPVVLFGPAEPPGTGDGAGARDPGPPSAEEVGGWAGTIAYEIFTRISRRVPRRYWQGGRVVGWKVGDRDD